MIEMNNPLEKLKVEQALRSEKMKLEYRKRNKPKEINILDYTVIEALQKQIPKKAVIAEKERFEDWECPNCKCLFLGYEHCNYCQKCGQKLDWGDEE